MDSTSAVVNAVGIGLGNASLIYSFAVIWIIYFAMGVSTLIWPKWRYETEEERIREIRHNDHRDSSEPPIEPPKSSSGLELEKSPVVDVQNPLTLREVIASHHKKQAHNQSHIHEYDDGVRDSDDEED